MEEHELGREAFADDEAYRLHALRHSTAHIMAEAIAEVFPGAKFAFGPPVEDGFYYDVDVSRPITEADLAGIEEAMRKVVKRNTPFVRRNVDHEEAASLFAGQTYKLEHIASLKGPLGTFEQGGFLDLCNGPHVPRTGNCKHFKLMKVSGAYWKGDASRPMLQRVYGTVWPTREALDSYLFRLEEAGKRDHRKVGQAMGLFFTHEWAPGAVFWLPKGEISTTRSRRPCAACCSTRATCPSAPRCSSTRPCGRRPATGASTRTTCSASTSGRRARRRAGPTG